MIYSLDTVTCIRFMNGRSKGIRQRFESVSPEEISICSVVRAELFYGVAKGEFPRQRRLRQEAFLGRFESRIFDDAAAVIYGRIRADLERKGTPIGPNDLLIAAIAIANGLVLVTHNTREFARVSGLKIEDWEIE